MLLRLALEPGGHYETLGNSVVSSVDMGSGGFGFGLVHSAQWVYSVQRTYPFWKEVLTKFDVDVTNQ